MADGSLKFDTKIDTEGIDKGTRSIKGSLNSFLQSVRNMGRGVESAFSGTASIDKADSKIRMLVDEIDQLSDGLYYLEKQGMYFGDKEYDEAYSKLQRLGKELNTYKKSLSGVDTAQKKTTKSMDKMSRSTRNGHMSMLKMLKMSLLFSVVFRALSAVMKGIGEGFKNLAQYSKQTNKDLSTLATSGQTLKNSFATAFAPILTAITSALKALIDHLAQAITVAGQFFAVFFNGATTFTRAKDAQIDYAKSLQKTAKDANKALSPIDKLNTVGDDAGASGTPGIPSPSQMFEEVPIDSKIIDFVDRLKTALQPMDDALTRLSDWVKNNKELLINAALVIGSFFAAFGIAQLVTAIGSLLPVLGAFISSGGLLSTILSGLSAAFTAIASPVVIITAILGLLIYSFIDLYRNSESFRQSIAELGRTWLTALKPLGDFIATVFTDAWNKILKPAIDFLVHTLFPQLIAICKQLWQNVLVPLGTFIGTVLQPVFKILSDILMSLWKNVVLPLANAIGTVLKEAWNAIYEIMTKTIIPIVKNVISVLTQLWKNVVNPIIDVLWKNLKPAFDTVFTGIGDLINGLKEILTGIIKFVTGVFTGNWSKAWDGIKLIFKGIWNSLVAIVKTPINLIIDLMNGMISGIVTGLNTIIEAANKISIKAPDWLGGKTYGIQLNKITAPKIPKLATGAVIPPNSEFLALLGDQKHGTNIEAPLDTIVEAFKRVGGGNNGNMLHVTLMLQNGKVLLDTIVEAENENYKQTGRPAFSH